MSPAKRAAMRALFVAAIALVALTLATKWSGF
jgi:hypothetical protein